MKRMTLKEAILACRFEVSKDKTMSFGSKYRLYKDLLGQLRDKNIFNPEEAKMLNSEIEGISLHPIGYCLHFVKK
jgi:hypothetical protein